MFAFFIKLITYYCTIPIKKADSQSNKLDKTCKHSYFVIEKKNTGSAQLWSSEIRRVARVGLSKAKYAKFGLFLKHLSTEFLRIYQVVSLFSSLGLCSVFSRNYIITECNLD